jgi:hypothetical protein
VGEAWTHQRVGVSYLWTNTQLYEFIELRPQLCSLYNKEEEFRAWLVEECKINPETISKDQTKKQFARFVEDYNTGEQHQLISI